MRGWDQQQGGDAAFVGHLPYRKEMPEEAPTGISSVISHKAFDCDSRPDTGRSISVNASVDAAAASSAAVVGCAQSTECFLILGMNAIDVVTAVLISIAIQPFKPTTANRLEK
ncbi:hypothetical protein BASA61_008182 [Batrachochytrium salamandrivorans]|nr:hypothetical protein BASA61_008182 [Batrachochytrium salamandrivorans]